MKKKLKIRFEQWSKTLVFQAVEVIGFVEDDFKKCSLLNANHYCLNYLGVEGLNLSIDEYKNYTLVSTHECTSEYAATVFKNEIIKQIDILFGYDIDKNAPFKRFCPVYNSYNPTEEGFYISQSCGGYQIITKRDWNDENEKAKLSVVENISHRKVDLHYKKDGDFMIWEK